MAKKERHVQNIKQINLSKQTINFVSKPVRKPIFGKVSVGLVLLVLAGTSGYLHFSWMERIDTQEAELEDVRSFINSDEIQDTYREAIKVEKAKEDLLGQFSEMFAIAAMHNDVFLVSDELLMALTNNIPGDVFLTSSNYQNGEVILNGYSKSYESVGQMAYNLRRSSQYNQVVIKSVEEVDGHFRFLMNAFWMKGDLNASK